MNLSDSILFILIFYCLEFFYVKIAKKIGIIDIPNQRSLHSSKIVRGGGVIFLFAVLFYYFIYSKADLLYFFIGFNIVSLVSFLDDINSTSIRIRIVFQAISVVFLMLQFQDSFIHSYLFFSFFFFFSLGFLNIYNFMDGINGMTGLYSLSILPILLYLNNFIFFIDSSFIMLVLFSVIIFLFFNFRKNAVCFAGDIGSIGLAYILLYSVYSLIFMTKNWNYLFIFCLYGIDSIYTLLYRMQMKENIFKAHKMHFYQILTYKYQLSHLNVAFVYFGVQLFLNLILISNAPLILLYISSFIIFIIVHLLRRKVNLGFSFF